MRLLTPIVACVAISIAGAALAATIVADRVIGFYNSGAGPIASGAYGGVFTPPSFPVAVPQSYASDGDSNTFVSLPTGSYMILGFSGDRFVLDQPGNDIFVTEAGSVSEPADIFVSSDLGASFTLLGSSGLNVLNAFDLAKIRFSGPVNAIKVVGRSNDGGSPGFDLAVVSGVEGRVTTPPDSPDTPAPVPLPPAALMLLAGLAGLGLLGRRRGA